MTNKDNLYQQQQAIEAFRFDERVADVFPDMIKRSVPGYDMMLEMISVITQRYANRENALCYDLGCSLGASTFAIDQGLKPGNNNKIIAIDNSGAMLEKARKIFQQRDTNSTIDFICQDITTTKFQPHQLSCMNFILQFIAEDKREDLLNNIYQSLEANGVLILSEKIQFTSNQQQELLTDLHHDFKRAHGYSDLEIAQKRTSLENVLIPETIDQHITRLEAIGFSKVSCWFQCFNFISLLAIK